MSDNPKLDRRIRVKEDGEVVKSNTPEAVAERKRIALSFFEQGMTYKQVATLIGISERMIYKWRKTDPVFAEQLATVRSENDALLADEMEDLAIQIARGGDGVTKDGLPNYSAVRDVLKVTNRERWGDKREVTHGGTVVHTLIPTARPLDALPTADEIEIPGRVMEESE